MVVCIFFFQAEDGIRDLVRSRGLGDVYKRQLRQLEFDVEDAATCAKIRASLEAGGTPIGPYDLQIAAQALRRKLTLCLLYTSDAADDLLCVDLGGRRIIKKKTKDDCYLHVQRHPDTHITHCTP